jgi:Cu2+-exporting ATPase
VAINSKLAGAIELHATIRPEAKQVVSELRKRKMEMVIISGDHENPTKKLPQELGIEHYFAETLPEKKADLISQLQEEGKSVCFVGDGINDSIALKKADVSISLRGASSAATDAAQIVLMKQDLNQLLQLFDVADGFERNMKVNLITTMIPGVVTLFGAFFLGFGVIHSAILNDIGAVIGASNAVWPWFKEQKKLESPQQSAVKGQPTRLAQAEGG